MADTNSTFTIFLKTVADATGVTDIKNSLGGLQSSINSLKIGLEALGLGITLQQLDAWGKKAIEVGSQQAAWTRQVLASKDGSAALVEELNNLNRELADTTGTSERSSREIERQLLLFGATREQVVALTKGIIDFAAARGRGPDELAFVISRALAGEDVMLNRLGLHLDKEKSHAEQVNELIAQLGKTAGTAAAIEEATGGMGRLEVQTERAEIALGRLVNTVRVPFLTQFTGSLGTVKQQIDGMTTSTESWGFKFALAAAIAGNSLRQLPNVLKALDASTNTLVDFLKLLATAFSSYVENMFETLVTKALDKLHSLVSAAATVASAIGGGLINIDFAKIDGAFDTLKNKVTGSGDVIRDTFRKSMEDVENDFTDSLKKLQEASDAMGTKLFSPAFRKQVEDQFKAIFASAASRLQGIQPGSGVITGSNQADREKAATDALTNAKFRLTQAQQSYELAVEKTKALEESGAITVEQADSQRAAAIRAYITQLNQIRASLPGIISQLQAMGKTEGANELRAELGKVDIQLIKLQTDLGNTTFLGKLRSSIVQLKNEWSDLGKTLGGFVTQQFQNFAQAGGQIVSGLLFRTGNLKQSILQLGEQFVASLAQMVIQWTLSRTILSALNKAFGTADTASATAQAGIADAAWKPAAIDASIATYGVAAATGLTAYLSAFSSGITTGLFSGFRSGGWTGAGRDDERAGDVHRNEFVFSAPRVRQIGLGLLQAVHSGALTFAKPGYRNGGFVGPGSGGIVTGRGSGNGDVHVFIFDDKRKAQEAMLRSPAGRKLFRDMTRKNRQ